MLNAWDAKRNRGPSFLNDDNVGEHTFRDRYRQVDEDEVCMLELVLLCFVAAHEETDRQMALKIAMFLECMVSESVF